MDEAEHVGAPGELEFAIGEFEQDLGIFLAVDRVGRHRFHEVDRLGDARLEIVEAGLIVLHHDILDPAEADHAPLAESLAR